MDILPFFMFGSKNPIYLESKIAQQVFIYGEYLKRKFWLDCNFEREGGQYKKQNNRYIPLAFIDYNDLLMRFEQILDIHIDSGAVFLDNSPIYKRAFQKCQNIYEIIRILLKYDYFYVRRKLLSSGTQKQTSKLLRKKRKNYDDKSFEFILSIYSYERMIWTMSDFVRMNLAKAETDFGVVAQMFYYSFGMDTNSGTYHLYAEIIKKYHLYLTDLLNLVSPEAIINDDYTKFILPRFINLPKLSLDNHKFKDLVEIDYNPLKKKLSLSLGISNK